ncbi:hypothetical protein KPL40_05115 [Clostridium gasigenes]|uniref:hypothetical protein n=1 Tax=Clostridium gasigenes TaxID=94869 RepID=UPI001C0C26E1|nr:hypothetical protein [Clostridium gasigenes]MBU3131825.1 hypothetical protein [Clostridium gasigenes]
MSYYGGCVLKPKEYNCKNVVRKTIVIRSQNKALLWGKVLDSKGRYIKNAVIEASKIDCNYNPYKVTKLGYTTTNNEGAYNICVKKGENIYYMLRVYSVLKNN